VGRAAAWARPVAACRARGGGRPVAACRACGRGGRQPSAWARRATCRAATSRARGAAASRARGAAACRAGGREKEVKGVKEGEERIEPLRWFNYLLCRVPAIRHSAKIFLKFKNKLCRVPDCGHSAKTSLPSASCTGTRQRSVLQSLLSANGHALRKDVFAEC
jgi:hypothetical protein